MIQAITQGAAPSLAKDLRRGLVLTAIGLGLVAATAVMAFLMPNDSKGVLLFVVAPGFVLLCLGVVFLLLSRTGGAKG